MYPTASSRVAFVSVADTCSSVMPKYTSDGTIVVLTCDESDNAELKVLPATALASTPVLDSDTAELNNAPALAASDARACSLADDTKITRAEVASVALAVSDTLRGNTPNAEMASLACAVSDNELVKVTRDDVLSAPVTVSDSEDTNTICEETASDGRAVSLKDLGKTPSADTASDGRADSPTLRGKMPRAETASDGRAVSLIEERNVLAATAGESTPDAVSENAAAKATSDDEASTTVADSATERGNTPNEAGESAGRAVSESAELNVLAATAVASDGRAVSLKLRTYTGNADSASLAFATSENETGNTTRAVFVSVGRAVSDTDGLNTLAATTVVRLICALSAMFVRYIGVDAVLSAAVALSLNDLGKTPSALIASAGLADSLTAGLNVLAATATAREICALSAKERM